MITLSGMSGSPVFASHAEDHVFVGMLVKKFDEFGLALPADIVLAVAEAIVREGRWRPRCVGVGVEERAVSSDDGLAHWRPRCVGVGVEERAVSSDDGFVHKNRSSDDGSVQKNREDVALRDLAGIPPSETNCDDLAGIPPADQRDLASMDRSLRKLTTKTVIPVSDLVGVEERSSAGGPPRCETSDLASMERSSAGGPRPADGRSSTPTRSRSTAASTTQLVVVSVAANSPAERAGLRLGDVIQGVEGRRCDSPNSLVEAVWRAGEQPIRVRVNGRELLL